jgi:endonuclease YncB( thermonuclease family)
LRTIKRKSTIRIKPHHQVSLVYARWTGTEAGVLVGLLSETNVGADFKKCTARPAPVKIPMRLSFVLPIVFACCVSAAAAETIRGRASVIDGDTLEIAGKRIRLHGADAPESSQAGKDRQGNEYRCGQRAALALADQIGSGPVSCEARDTDRYGRIVAVCSQRGIDLNAWMVEQGHALAYRQYSTDYVPQEEAARAAKRGIWSGSFTPPSEYRRGGDKASEKSPDYWSVGRILRIVEGIMDRWQKL